MIFYCSAPGPPIEMRKSKRGVWEPAPLNSYIQYEEVFTFFDEVGPPPTPEQLKYVADLLEKQIDFMLFEEFHETRHGDYIKVKPPKRYQTSDSDRGYEEKRHPRRLSSDSQSRKQTD